MNKITTHSNCQNQIFEQEKFEIPDFEINDDIIQNWTKLHIDIQRVHTILNSAKLPKIEFSGNSIPWSTVREHVKKHVAPAYNSPSFNKPEHGEPPTEKDRIKSLFIRWLLY